MSNTAGLHQSFAQHHHLPFVLLSDGDNHVRKLYGVQSTLSLFPGRVTFAIDKGVTVRHIFSSQMIPTKPVDESLRIIAELQGKEQS